jgi:hypothetical protein
VKADALHGTESGVGFGEIFNFNHKGEWKGFEKGKTTLRENWIASGVKFIAACGVYSYTILILRRMRPIKIAKDKMCPQNKRTGLF